MVRYLFMNCITLLYTSNHVYVTYDINHKGNASYVLSRLRDNKSEVCACIAEMVRKNRKGPSVPTTFYDVGK